jgi:hypothetical protein
MTDKMYEWCVCVFKEGTIQNLQKFLLWNLFLLHPVDSEMVWTNFTIRNKPMTSVQMKLLVLSLLLFCYRGRSCFCCFCIHSMLSYVSVVFMKHHINKIAQDTKLVFGSEEAEVGFDKVPKALYCWEFCITLG